MKIRIAMLSLALAFCAGSTITASAMSSSDFKSKVTGKNWKWKKGTAKGTIIFSSSGSVTTTIKGKKKTAKDSGRWRWKNNRICIKYKTFAKGKERCAGISSSGRGFKMSTGSRLY